MQASIFPNSSNEAARAKTPTFFETLKEITQDQREPGYAHPLINFLRTAIWWSIQPKFRQANVVITPLDVTRMMIDFKQARLDNAYHTDSITDAAGYASCAARIDEKLKDIGYEEGIKVFDHITIAGMIDMLTKLEIKGLVDCGG